MSQDNEDDEASTDAGIPSFAEAVQERKKHIAWLRKEGDHERADLIAKCRKHNRCLQGDCPVCDRRREVAFSRYPELAIHDTEEPLLGIVLHEISVDAIKVVGPRRRIDEKKLAALKASITLIGLQTPITVKKHKGKFILVAGWYRLTAVKQLGAATIACFCHYDYQVSEIDTYLWQRAENVNRAGPRVLERAEDIDEMRRAILQQGGQVAPPGGRQPNNAGIKRAAKVLGFTRDEVRRSMRIAEMISPEAKADDNEDALLQIAKLPANAQCAALNAIVDGQLAARARLASRAVAVASDKAAAKIQAIEDKIAKKKETLQALKAELGDERDRLDGVHDELVAAYVNNALITGAAAQPADNDVVTVRVGSLSPEDEARFAAVVEAWNKARELKAELANASPMVLERYIAMTRSWVAQESKKTKESDESD